MKFSRRTIVALVFGFSLVGGDDSYTLFRHLSSSFVVTASLTFLLQISSVVCVYEQVGLDINGEFGLEANSSEIGDEFGWSVSISADGTTCVVGAPMNDGNGSNSGHVRVFKYNTSVSTFTQVGLDINGEALGDRFGYSVSISADGTTFIVGAPYNSEIGVSSGHVRVYKYISNFNRYAQVGLDIDGEAMGDLFGWSVSISADGATFVVGAPFNDGKGDGSGHARVYKYNSSISNYTQVGLDIDGADALDRFGYSVSISADGTTFVVGTRRNDGNGDISGHIRVYKYNSTVKSYTQLGLYIDGANFFRSSVSISSDGTTFVVGAKYADGNGTDFGLVRIYKYIATINSFAQVGSDIVRINNLVSSSSVSISADGTTFVVGDVFINVRVYKYNSSVGSYTQDGLDIIGEKNDDSFGWSVDISADGSTFVVGAPYNDGNGVDSGHIRVYRETTPVTISPSASPETPPVTISPSASPENCGLFGWKLFCPRRGKCGLFKRWLNLGNCN